MRKFKFRAWLIYESEMVYSDKEPNRFHFGNGYMHIFKQNDELYYPRIIPMQFTGLLDKNGKEIYEGDIVRIYSHPPHFEFDVPQYYDKEVIWVTHRGAWMFGDFIGDAIKASHSEVIGNIYENPDLLTKSIGER